MYIEFVIADNFVLTMLAGATATRLCHKRVNMLRLAIASAVGTAVAVFYPFITSVAVQLAVKLALYALLCFILFFRTSRPVTSSLLFLGSTFTYGGACYALGLVIYSSASGAAAFCKRCPLFVVLSSGAAVYFFVRYVLRRTRIARARAPYEYGADIEVYGATLHFNGFVDTGNCVFDEVTGLPVVITDTGCFSQKLGDAALIEFLKSMAGLRRMTVRTPAGEAKAYMVRPTRVTVYSDRHEHKIDAMIGLVGGSGFFGSHELLLNPALLTEGV